MSIKFFNIRSKEVREAETEPQLTALWASSDHSPNITQGQDFGWRLAPEVVVEMKKIKQDYEKIVSIAHRFNMLPEDVGEPEILQYISERTESSNAPLAQEGDYTDEYEQEIRRLEKEHEVTPQTATTTTTKSVAQLEAELEARYAVEGKTTTTTTEAAPATTTTTTKK